MKSKSNHITLDKKYMQINHQENAFKKKAAVDSEQKILNHKSFISKFI